MPLVVGGDDDVKIGGSSSSTAAGGQGFDLQTAQTLFWKPVPVLLRQADREDQHEELTFRILSGVSRANHNMRVCVLRSRDRLIHICFCASDFAGHQAAAPSCSRRLIDCSQWTF